jgi:F-type H+-transporting ATPase subunit gamma
MPNKSQEELQQLSSLKSMVRVTGEIASGRMQKARKGVLYRRDYLAELSEVFRQVHRSFLAKKGKDEKEKATRFTTLSHNGKNVAVFISANTRLYGDLLSRTFERFWQDVEQNHAEVTVVGKVGEQMVKGKNDKLPMTVFSLTNERIEGEELEKLLKHLVPYEEIHIYYGKYVNPVRQEAEEYTISAELPQLGEEKNEPMVEYIYEPTLEEVMKFFENQIFNTMFEQTVVEASLAKHAARFVAMDRAEQQIDKKVAAMRKQLRVVKHREDNKKQLNQMGPILMRFRGGR